jgi:DNA polymerase (family X)
MTTKHRINSDIATRLEEVANLLEAQEANPYRVEAYRRAAMTVSNWPEPLDEFVKAKGLDGLRDLPGIGESLSRSLHQLATTGQWGMLERLRGAGDPVEVLASVPGIGKRLAERLYTELAIHSLEELEAAAHDGRLLGVEGFGSKRIAGIRDSLASRLGRVRKPVGGLHTPAPAVSEILNVDEEYRTKAQGDGLPKIAPRRFNPKQEAWLPILHTTRGERHYTALYSNTAHAHHAGKTHDWVVIFHDDSEGERQNTVITAERGPMAGRRIVRGREQECLRFYFDALPRPIARPTAYPKGEALC